MRLSREKLSFLVDCTSAPIASIVPVSTWVSFELALINQAIKSIGYDSESGYTLFLNSIGKSFYAWFRTRAQIKIHGAFVALHAIDATPARRRGAVPDSLLDCAQVYAVHGARLDSRAARLGTDV